MRWAAIGGVTLLIVLMIGFEWPRIKGNPTRDKVAFFALLAFGWILSMFDLPNTDGPGNWLEALFRPVWKAMNNVLPEVE